MATGLLSKDIVLSYDLSGVMTALPDLQEIPDLGVAPEKVEVTTLADGARRYINGIKDYGDLAFTFLYGNEATDSFRILRGLEEAGTVQSWEVELADGTVFAFDGFPSVALAGAGVNAAMTFTLNIALQSDISIDFPA